MKNEPSDFHIILIIVADLFMPKLWQITDEDTETMYAWIYQVAKDFYKKQGKVEGYNPQEIEDFIQPIFEKDFRQ